VVFLHFCEPTFEGHTLSSTPGLSRQRSGRDLTGSAHPPSSCRAGIPVSAL
jgi:hypothetical protein